MLLIVGSARIVLRVPSAMPAKLVFFGLLIWVAVGYFGFWQSRYLYPARAPSIPISFWVGKGVVQSPEPLLEDLQSAGGWLYINVRPSAFDGETGQAMIDGLRRLAERDMDVYLAVTTSDYLSVPVHDQWITNVRSIAATVQTENLSNVRGIMGDAEQPKSFPLDILGRDRDDFFLAMESLEYLKRFIADEYPDVSLGVTALWTLHLDSFDGDPDLSIIHRSSVEPPGNWDFVNVMTYSSYVPPSWRAYYVYLVERAMARLYPDLQPSHLLGLADQGWPGEPVLEYDDLLRDARLSRAMGVREIVVFRLNDRALEMFGDDFVGRLAAAVNDMPSDEAIEVPFSRPASMLIFGTLFADSFLDVQNSRGVLLLGWMALSAFLVTYFPHQGRRRSRR